MTTAPPSRKGQTVPSYQSDPNRPQPPELDRRQAAALQRLVWQRFATIDALPADSQDFDLHERAVALLCKLADAWHTLVSIKRELRGIPRIGQLSPAERAEMRRRKSARSSRTAPTLAKPAAPTLAVPPPSDAA